MRRKAEPILRFSMPHIRYRTFRRVRDAFKRERTFGKVGIGIDKVVDGRPSPIGAKVFA